MLKQHPTAKCLVIYQLFAMLAKPWQCHLMHVISKPELADHDTMKDLLQGVIPLLSAGGDHCKLVVGPIKWYRYIPQHPQHQIRALWGQDPVHLTTAAYKAMAEKAVTLQ